MTLVQLSRCLTQVGSKDNENLREGDRTATLGLHFILKESRELGTVKSKVQAQI